MVALTHYCVGMSEPGWWVYFRSTAGTEDGATIAQATGVTAPQVSRWKSSKNRPSADSMARFARHYGRPPVEALVAAGYLTADEAGDAIEIERGLDTRSDDELIEEVRRRLAAARASVSGRGLANQVQQSPAGFPAAWTPTGEPAGVLRNENSQ
jgi:transcriptional regulator with XRE-family HTH domain